MENQLILQDRKSISITGVNSVNDFDENRIVLKINKESVVIKGNSLNIVKFDAEKGEFSAIGVINEFFYKGARKNLAKKVFK